MRNTLTSSAIMLAVSLAIGCDHSRGHVDAGAGTAPDAGPVDGRVAGDGSADPGAAAMRGGPPCMFSADCPAGEHCDLAECVEDCSATRPCGAGNDCSPRGRCLAPGSTDVEPPPLLTRKGTVRADPDSIPLTDRDTELRIHLVADSTDAVRYRVVVDGPYLSIAEPRGEFRDETVIRVAVNGSKLSGSTASGSVRVITNLGDVAVSAPIAAGLTGRYEGSLSYDAATGSAVSLGHTRVGLDVREDHGDVLFRVDPERSLLFPVTADGHAVVGRGIFTISGGAELSVTEVLPAGFAGEDDLFQRALGREVHFHLKPSEDGGALDGTFDETIYGLFQAPVTLQGHAHLTRETCPSDAGCAVAIAPPGDAPKMPTVNAGSQPEVASLFPGWTDDTCGLEPFAHLVRSCRTLLDCATAIDDTFHRPLLDALSGNLPSTSNPLGDLATICTDELARTDTSRAVHCAQIVPLACTLRGVSPSSVGQGATGVFATLYAHTLDPALFVAQDDIVKALAASFISGFGAERELLGRARAVLVPPLEWVLHPGLLEQLRRLPTKGADPSIEPPSFAAARTLARALYVLATLDAETARLASGARVGNRDDARRAAQNKGLLALFEAATLAGVARTWAAVPNELGPELVDVLTPMDAGFSSLLQGALVFGVPEGLVPNVYEPGRKPTNFEQLLDMASSRVQSASRDEATFTAANREFESNEDRLETELATVSAGFEDRIKSACGDAFDLTAADWKKCGADGTGTVGSRLLAIQQATAHLESAQNAIKAKYDHIRIESNRIAQVQGIRESTIAFTANTGEQLQALTIAEGILNAEEKFVEVASQANVMNGGAPIGEAAFMAAIEGMKTALESDRQAVQTAQELRVQEDSARVEVADGMAAVKGLLVDMAQMKVEMRQDVIGVLQSRLDAENEVSDAKRAMTERLRALGRIGESPLRDPTFRLLAERAAQNAMSSRADAQRALFEAGRGLEYHLNRPIGEALEKAVLDVFDADEATRLEDCFQSIFDESRSSMPKAEAYTTVLSVRKLLGINGPLVDEVTGRQLSEAEQFRLVLLRNENLDGKGGVGIDFASTLDPGNELWSADVCDDRITQVEAQLVGDFLGDDQAEVRVELDDGGVLRRCDDDQLMSWSTSGHAVIQAGVNDFGSAPPNDSLHDLPVASSKWRVVVPGATSAPSNADLELIKLEDIVLRVHHQARPRPAVPVPVSFDCLGRVGGGL